MARFGKIAQLPFALREEVNRRLRDRQPGSVLLPWLNALPEARAVLDAHFAGEDITDQNLSAWRNGGFAQWLARLQRLDHTRELAKLSVEFTKAGAGSLTDGAATIVAGEIIDLLEQLQEMKGRMAEAETPDPAALGTFAESLTSLSAAVSRLRSGDDAAARTRLERDKLAQGEQALGLARARFQRDTCEMFLRWQADQRAREVAAGSGSNTEKIEALGQLMFGDTWRPADESPSS